jgi:hypothetical protein
MVSAAQPPIRIWVPLVTLVPLVGLSIEMRAVADPVADAGAGEETGG